jgi:hypothetical protein
MFAYPDSTEKSDRVAIHATIEKYLEAAHHHNTDIGRQAFWPDAIMHGFLDADLIAGPIENLFQYWASNRPPSTKPDAAIELIGLTPTVAVVRLLEESKTEGHSFVDFHSLLKKDNQWKIQAKVFHAS